MLGIRGTSLLLGPQANSENFFHVLSNLIKLKDHDDSQAAVKTVSRWMFGEKVGIRHEELSHARVNS
jgi:hypothetical protein